MIAKQAIAMFDDKPYEKKALTFSQKNKFSKGISPTSNAIHSTNDASSDTPRDANATKIGNYVTIC